MRISRKTTSIIIFFFLLFTVSLSPLPETSITIVEKNGREYVSLHDFVDIFNVYNSFDIITGRGKLFYRDSSAVYQVGFSIILINGILEKSEYPILRFNGEIFFPLSFSQKIVNHFHPSSVIKRKANLLYIEKKLSYKGDEPTDVKKSREFYSKWVKDKISFIVIDPGHGGKDPGAVGKGRVMEKNITLSVSKYLKEFLNKKLKGIKIILTRNSDVFIELMKRTEIANKMLEKNENGLFVSIHVNASISASISGFETYFLSQNPSNEEARTTAALENNVIVLEEKSFRGTYDDVEQIEALMLTTQIQKESSMLANCIQSEMDKRVREFKSKGVKKADFFVLRGVLMPAALVEIGFISNRKEAAVLRKKRYQKKIAYGIGDGVISFINRYNKILQTEKK